QLARYASTTAANFASVWEIFEDQHELSLWQKFKAGIVYWVAYKSGLLQTITDVYVKTIARRFLDPLTTAGEGARKQLIAQGVQYLAAFFEQDAGVIEAHAQSAANPGEIRDAGPEPLKRERIRQLGANDEHNRNFLRNFLANYGPRVIFSEAT